MIFDTIRKHLKSELSEVEYENYLAGLIFDEDASKSDLVVLKAANPFVAKWVESKYGPKIAHLFELQTGIKPEVKVGIGKAKKSQKDAHKFDSTVSIAQKNKSTILNPSWTFDSFVVGSSNQFAHTAALSVSEKPGRLYNPLFIYGGVGLGKTHLLQAIGNKLSDSGKNVIYATIEQFMNDFTSHLRNQTMDRFREKYRNCDALLIDDAQFLSNKESTQEEFFHTFNELQSNGKQIVMTSDKHPKQIGGLEARLKSRFESGLIADIAPPELETKIAIVNKKCELNGIHLNSEVTGYIAATLGESIREIEGVIIKLNAFAKMMGQEISLEFAKNVLKDQLRETRENITIDHIVDIVSKELNIKSSEIRSKSRSTMIVNARRIVIYLARNLTPNSMPMIATYFGMKDHTAVSHSIKKINETIKNDRNFEVKLEELKNKIKIKDEV
ncbi:MAG: chromosomal replication initiator protein DnaA [Campylobacterales bacterium]|nr:chromosomal replication initiator protein DnaA [Campylobacterales bacterium]